MRLKFSKNKFDYDNYIIFLQILKEKYNFTSFSNYKYNKSKTQGNLIIRHDIDFSLEKALTMAELENEIGVISTYFIFLNSPFYNIFSEDTTKIVEKIILLKHNIGLHFDCKEEDFRSQSVIAYKILKQVNILQESFGVKLDAVSFHRPFNIEMLSRIELNNIPHAYEKIFVEDFKYFSDSRGRWRFGHPFDSIEFKQGKNLHILIHPIWWNHKNNKVITSINNFKKNMLKRLEKYIYSELKGFWEEYENKLQIKKKKIVKLLL